MKKYHRTNWVQTDSEFAQFQALCKFIKKRDPKWTFQQCFTLLLQEAVQACNMLYTLLTGIAEVSPEANKLLQTVDAKRSIDFADSKPIRFKNVQSANRNGE